jgi:hypothetical protein
MYQSAGKANTQVQQQRISARISDSHRCFSGLFRPALQDFCGADEIGG